MRIGRGQKLLDDVFMTRANSVTNLNIVRDDWQLVVANINGSVSDSPLVFRIFSADIELIAAGVIRPAICARVYSTVDLLRTRQFLYNQAGATSIVNVFSSVIY
jgi:hypothetical protein